MQATMKFPKDGSGRRKDNDVVSCELSMVIGAVVH